MMIASCYRRALLGVSFCVLATHSALPALADQITFVSQGGAYQKAQTIAILDPSAKKLGITINQDSIPDAWPAIKSQVASGKPTWDVVDVPTGYCLRGGEQGLLEKLDFSKLPNGAAMPEAYRSPYSVAYEFYSSVLAYSQKKFSAEAAPNSWADFWDVKAFPGPRSLRNHPVDNIEAALMADGVAADKLYPLDVDRAFKKLDEIHKHINVWWSTGQQPAQLLVDKEVVLAMMADPKRQAANAEVLGYSGMHLDSNQYVSEKIRPLLPLYPENLKQQLWLDQEWWTKNGAEMGERWNKWMLSKA